ncbi:hypothetical protein BDV95DRAFT_398340 [Massariosphaeria phaeospora]|uniref:SGNH hydrolase-type esterase domain-containing protein n=1 Tax=Massariosphaeria phaeospora TaxID=100035 RepID=A0A7C8MQW0_9PLEO|nr:hypothetical protein BDV95DRAFT_398340 [Massariosphaeria phaeospora]
MISLPKLVVVGLSMVTCVYSSNGTNITETQILSEDRSFSVGSALRIQPLGDSITWGQGSSDGNGYRYKLLRLLAGNDITYIGSERSGSMANSNNEGHPGALISEMSLHALKSLHLQPNVILVLAGTNDIYKDVDPATAPARLGSLIDNLITMSPHAAILVAQIPPMNDTSRNAVAQTFNAAIPGIVASRAGSGAKVLAVERDPRFSTRYLADGLHPDDMGHGLLADMFSAGIQRAAEAGWISEPVPLPTSNRTVCDTFLTWDPKFGTIAIGVGSADSAFVSSWQPAGRLAIGHVGPPKTWWGEELPQGKWVRLADMDGDGRDDYLWVHPNTGAAILYLNGGYSVEGGVNWISKGEIATGIGEAAGVMFADINGDGRDDFLWISPGGLVTAYINGGEKEGGGWLWTSVGQIAGEGTGATRETTRFADIDGDGRADYMVVGAEGSLNAWLNVGYGDKPDWTPLGIIATGIGDAAGVQLFDLNNDGRADYIWLDKDGAAKAYINNRGSGGLAPDWINAGSIATGVGAKREELRFADLNGDGKKDYVWVDRVSGALDVWFNTATGGSYVVGDGTVFADMDGDGFEDYLAISPNGAIELWLNHGHDPTSLKWIWDGQGQIATGVAARKDIRVADLDGDGLADYLVVDENSGAVVFWRNGGRQNDGSWSWTNMGQVATGVGDGPGVRFADINGDGKADYLWVAKDGSVKAYLNGGSGSNGWVWESRGVIAKGVGAPRQDIKFADINGDGLADYLWVNRLDGSVSEWQRNGGMRDEWQWIPQGQIAAGVGANGLTVQFASLSGSGRADYLKGALPGQDGSLRHAMIPA